MVPIGFFLSFFLGTIATSTFATIHKSEIEGTRPLILDDQQNSLIHSVERIVDSRFKLLAADFQDQIYDLKGQMVQLQGRKTTHRDASERQHQHDIQKRQTNTAKPTGSICETSSSFCTFFYPDHPDSGHKKGNYSPIITPETEILKTQSSTLKGMPTSCNDLQLLGHKLNGLYLVKAARPNQGSKFGTVFCDFQSSTAVKESHELILGNVEVKTKSVHFYVQRQTSFGTLGVIPFELDPVNEGEAMKLSSGVFTAPVHGIYHFSFAGVKDFSSYNLGVFLQVNGENVAVANANPRRTGGAESISMTASLRLKAGDKVNLWLSIGVLVDDISHYTHFTGWLVEEDLMP